ncbi:MAG: prolyl aminopeptidase [Alphaproteobacteria bacterium]|nr:prolyl aminopeptidase [Alphaproteobacteria bacterium]
MARTDLYPPIEPYATGTLRVDRRHSLYYEQCGNAAGVPVLFLHGGPGAGATAAHRRFFDPAFYRIVIFDQRGAGRSTPTADIADNTTPLLVQDIETLRQTLGIERWLLFGGSWGSTLALAYGEAHPQRCLGFVLRGIFLSRDSEIDWFLHGLGQIFPEAQRAFAGFLPLAERGDLLASYYRRLIDPDPAVHRPAARAWSSYEAACSTLLPNADNVAAVNDDRVALALARIEAHYFVNKSFLAPDSLMANLGRIAHLPAVIVHGRYDMVCPITTGDLLARAWKGSEFTIVPDAGHSAMEPGIRAALVGGTERFKRSL